MPFNQNSSTPNVIFQGVKDNSSRALPMDTPSTPQQVVLIYFFAQRGPTTRFTGSATAAATLYGGDTFAENSKYFNHQTLLRNIVTKAGGVCCYQRVTSKDTGVRSNVRVWIDVLKTKIKNYQRTSKGTYMLNEDNGKILDENEPYIEGYLVKWFSDHNYMEDPQRYGMLSTTRGKQIKWEMRDEDIHLLYTESNVPSLSAGLVQYANKKVYIYESLEDMWSPVKDATRRRVYTIDADGTRSEPVEEIFGISDNTLAFSTMYPIFEVYAKEVGEYYNNVGISLASVTGDDIIREVVEGELNLPYKISLWTRPNNLTSPSVFKTLTSEDYSVICLDDGVTNPSTLANLSFDNVIANSWFNTLNKDLAMIYPLLDTIYLYKDNLKEINRMFMLAEKANFSLTPRKWGDGKTASTAGWYSFVTTNPEQLPKEYMLINPFSCRTMANVDYKHIQYGTDRPVNSVGFAELNMGTAPVLFLNGGSDGSMDKESYHNFIIEDMRKYADQQSDYMDFAINKETMFIDTGFPKEVKAVLGNFIQIRKDTVLGVCTHFDDLGTQYLGIGDTTSIGAALVNNLRLAPESEVFGTPAMRAFVVAQTGRTLDSDKRYSLIIDLAEKIIKLIGGSDRKWNGQQLFATRPNSEIKRFVDIQPSILNYNTRGNWWRNGINMAYPTSTNSFFYPGLKTVYPDETSVANSLINMLAVSFCERVGFEVWEEVTGDVRTPPETFVENVTRIANDKLAGAFDGILTAIAKGYLDEFDKVRGFTWHLDINLYGNVSKTKQILSIGLFRTEMEE